MRNTTIDIHPLTGAIGAEILNIDLTADHPEQTWLEIAEAFREHGVIFFRDQKLTPEDQIKFTNRFGTMSPSKLFTPVPGYPEMEEVRKEPDAKRAIGDVWHSDQTYREAPTRGTVLYCLESPTHGGDTSFLSMAKAYDALSDGLKHTLEGLRAIHSNAEPLAAMRHGSPGREHRVQKREETEVSHPVVIRMPENGRKVLFVNPSKTMRFEGWTEQESDALLEYLYRHSERPEFQCRFRWQEGSLAFWDNYQVWHYATNDYHGQRRVMHRTTVDMEP